MHKWQLARKTQCPSRMPSSSIRSAIGPCPCPRDSEKNLSPIPRSSALAFSITTGSTPGESTKMSGAVLVESTYAASRSKGGGSTNLGPRLLATNEDTANTTRSGRRKRIRRMRCSSLHLFSHSPGSGASSGVGFLYHLCQSWVFCSNADEIFRMLASRESISVRLSHAASGIHSGAGFGACTDLSTSPPPRRKNWYSSRLILDARCRILTHIWSEKRSLCFSNSDRQMFRYTAAVWKVLRCFIRSSRS
mmetsp:Transcript_48474/g.115308  ORF Transcript_48474/g.115308 Transcript_48474/m.115308 type:complete len:249 (+) Transcript_48474:491-1237(+)